MDNEDEDENLVEYESNIPNLIKIFNGTTYLDILIYNGLKMKIKI